MKSPRIIGLTGSIGMGKSTVAAMFEDLGVPVFDADAEVRKMQGPGGSLLPAIEGEFPGSTNQQGVLRKDLGRMVFADPEALTRLEAIVHPAVKLARADFLASNQDAPMVLFDIPLLFEKSGTEGIDVIVVVSAPAQIQRERVLARPDMTEEKFADILELQLPDEEKRERADFVIDTGCSLSETQEQVSALVEKLSAA